MKMSEKRIFTLKGMHCAACAAAIERAVKKIPGCSEVYVNLAANELSVPPCDISDEEILKAIAKAGFSGELQQKDTFSKEEKSSGNEEKRSFRELIFAWISGILVIICCHAPIFDSFLLNGLIQFLLLLCVMAAGRKIFTGGIPALLRGTPDMNSLIAAGVLSGILYSLFTLCTSKSGHLVFEAGAMILMLVMLGKFLECRSKHKAANALYELTQLVPENTLQILPGGREVSIPVSDIQKGMTFKVLPGMKIPADGTVLSGNSSCNESMFSGESLPVEKHPGSAVIGGSINNEGVLLIKGESTSADSLLARIISVVKEAQGSRAPIARIADRVSRFFVWGVLFIGVCTFLFHLLLGSGTFAALNFALSVLVVACPCSLGLATPMALICGTARGARGGILIKNGAVMETLAKVKTLVFDKTGTLTTGKFSITEIKSFHPNWDEFKLLSIAGALEKNSAHPLAQAVLKACEEKQIELPEISDCTTIPGKGLQGTFAKRTFELVRPEKEDLLNIPGQTAMVLKENGTSLGAIFLCDTLRSESSEVLTQLKKMGFHAVMLTGDNEGAAEKAAQCAGIEEWYAGVLPAEKSSIIKELQGKYGKVAMIGDGINDAPALCVADVGIAIGGGSPAAMESADAVLLTCNLQKVPELFKISSATMRVIRQNLFWAFAYNALGIPLAAGIFAGICPLLQLPPAYCAAAMGASSITVVLNALRLLKI